uniref:Uncharacterized protein n=1 Tax=Desulfacinum infernum TaxID=35837 RepID=A0A832A5H6_9BACT
MPHYADVVHQTSTRVRIKMKHKVRDPAFYRHVQETVADIPGVAAVRANPATGSFLFTGTNLNAEIIMEALARKTPLRFEAPPAGHPVQRAIRPFMTLDQKFKRMTSGEVGLTEAGFLALLAIGVIQILRGNITAPPWYTAFWYAFGVFSKALVEKYTPSSPKSFKPHEEPVRETYEPGPEVDTSEGEIQPPSPKRTRKRSRAEVHSTESDSPPSESLAADVESQLIEDQSIDVDVD